MGSPAVPILGAIFFLAFGTAGVAIDRLATWFPGLADIVRVETPVSGRLDVAFDPVETRLARAALTMRTGRGAAVMAGRLASK